MNNGNTLLKLVPFSPLYADDLQFVQFLGTSEDGQRLKFRLCNGEDVNRDCIKQ